MMGIARASDWPDAGGLRYRPHLGLHHAHENSGHSNTNGLIIRPRRQQFPISGFQ